MEDDAKSMLWQNVALMMVKPVNHPSLMLWFVMSSLAQHVPQISDSKLK